MSQLSNLRGDGFMRLFVILEMMKIINTVEEVEGFINSI